MSRRRSGVDWNELRWIIESSLKRTPEFATGYRVEGRITWQGEGIGHDNYIFDTEDERLVLRLGKRYRPIRSEVETRESLLREAETLRQVAESDFPYPTPEWICMAQDERGTHVGLIESYVDGTPLSFFDNPNHEEYRINATAEVAAEVHRLPVEDFGHLEPAADRRSHVLALLESVPERIFAEYPATAQAKKWITNHLPEGPAVVLHGDLLPQNLLLDFTETMELGVIDWEYARIGDPAFDLAIVTRGARKPLKASGGFQRLLDAYNKEADTPVSANAVRVHELLLHMNWIAESDQARRDGTLEGQGPGYFHDQLTALVRRVCGGG